MEIPQVVRTYVDTWSGADLDRMVGLLLSLLTETYSDPNIRHSNRRTAFYHLARAVSYLS
jgi:hypothetical protein